MLFISIPTSQGTPTNIIESSQELSDKDFFCLIIILLQSLVICNYNLVTSTWVCSIRILSSVGVYYPAPLALLLLYDFTSYLDPSHLAYFGTHPIVLLAMRCWHRQASASTLLWCHTSTPYWCHWMQYHSNTWTSFASYDGYCQSRWQRTPNSWMKRTLTAFCTYIVKDTI